MARAFVAASSQFLEINSAVASMPFSFACWYRPTSIGTAGTIFSITTSASANNFFRTDISATGNNRTRARDAVSVSDAITTGAMSAGAWSFVGSRFVSATDRSAFLGTEKVNSTTSRAPTGMNRTSLGRSAESAGTSYADGSIAYAAIWNVGLSDADYAQLARGTHPLKVRPDALIAFWPLIGVSPEVDWISKSELSITGATKTDNPRITLP